MVVALTEGNTMNDMTKHDKFVVGRNVCRPRKLLAESYVFQVKAWYMVVTLAFLRGVT